MAQDVPDPPALGDAVDTWIQALGPPNDHSTETNLHFQRCPGSSIDQFVVDSDDGHVWAVRREPCRRQSETPALAHADAERFLPGDTTGGEAFSTPAGNPAWQYMSPSFGDVLSPDQFDDCDGNPVQPGTFSITTSSGGWLLLPGTCLD
jgi:hypothetical protein